MDRQRANEIMDRMLDAAASHDAANVQFAVVAAKLREIEWMVADLRRAWNETARDRYHLAALKEPPSGDKP